MHSPSSQPTGDNSDEEPTETVTDNNGTVQDGDTVEVHYVGRLQSDDTVFDTSREDVAQENEIYNEQRPYEPIQFTIGAGQMIPGFEQGVIGMEVGESKTIEVSPEEGYGPVRDDLVQTFPVEEFASSGLEPEVGETYNFGVAAGTVQSISGEQVTIDFNHFLAGKALVFEVELVDINPEGAQVPQPQPQQQPQQQPEQPAGQ